MAGSRTTIANAALDALGEPAVADIDQLPDGALDIHQRMARGMDDAIEDVLQMRAWNRTRRAVRLTAQTDESAPGWAAVFAIPEGCMRILHVGPASDAAAADGYYLHGALEHYEGAACDWALIDTEKGPRLAVRAAGPVHCVFIAAVDAATLPSLLRGTISAWLAAKSVRKNSENRGKADDLQTDFLDMFQKAAGADAKERPRGSRTRPASSWMGAL